MEEEKKEQRISFGKGIAWYEYTYMICSFLFSFGYFYCEPFRCFVQNRLSIAYRGIPIIIFLISIVFLYAFYLTSKENMREFNAENNAYLRSVRDEFAILAVIIPLFIFALQELDNMKWNDYKVALFYIAFHASSLLVMYYRRLNYDIYMQEAKKEQFVISGKQNEKYIITIMRNTENNDR